MVKRLSGTEGHLFDIDYGRPLGTAIIFMIDTKYTIKSITDNANLVKAYLNVVGRLFSKSNSKHYRGLDGIASSDTDGVVTQLLNVCRDEILSACQLIPVVSKSIPKVRGGTRSIYIYSIKDRIKAQAIYQILEPIIEKCLSDYLYSYRTSKPSYYAAKGVVRRYLKYCGLNYIYVTDLQNYGESIDHQILVEKLVNMGFNEEFVGYIKPYFQVNYIDESGQITSRKSGLITGVPLVGLFSNVYLNDLDHTVGKQVDLYRRVGDDLIIMDKSAPKVKRLVDAIHVYAGQHKLTVHKNKTYIGWDSGSFEYLGYEFIKGDVLISSASINRLIQRIQLVLPIGQNQPKRAMRNLRYHFYKRINSILSNYRIFVKQHLLIKNYEQFKLIDNEINHYLTRYVFNQYTERNHRLLNSMLRQNKIPSLSKTYESIINEYRRTNI